MPMKRCPKFEGLEMMGFTFLDIGNMIFIACRLTNLDATITCAKCFDRQMKRKVRRNVKKLRRNNKKCRK